LRIFGSKSGFKNARDLILFIFGLGICVYHIAVTPPDDLSIPLLLFGAGLAGVPYLINLDEKRDK
jgi:hypothetical protein